MLFVFSSVSVISLEKLKYGETNKLKQITDIFDAQHFAVCEKL